jgi:hypothetical protein
MAPCIKAHSRTRCPWNVRCCSPNADSRPSVRRVFRSGQAVKWPDLLPTRPRHSPSVSPHPVHGFQWSTPLPRPSPRRRVSPPFGLRFRAMRKKLRTEFVETPKMPSRALWMYQEVQRYRLCASPLFAHEPSRALWMYQEVQGRCDSRWTDESIARAASTGSSSTFAISHR